MKSSGRPRHQRARSGRRKHLRKSPFNRLNLAVATVVAVALIAGIAIVLAHTQSRANDTNPDSASAEPALLTQPEVVAPTPTPTPTPVPEPEPPMLAGVNLTTYSATEASSLWVVVNKAVPLDPRNYEPELTTVAGASVDPRSADDLRALLSAARAAGAPLDVVSAFRSHNYQAQVYQRNVNSRGSTAAADRWSARPGHSEHQTGLAIDVSNAGSNQCVLHTCFAETQGGQWVAANAHTYGFIVRYTAANSAVTGYNPEPWHLRYIGRELAQAMHESGVTNLEEVFGIPGGDYVD